MTSRILIADDHGVIRAGLHALLEAEPDIQVVGEAANSDETMQLAGELNPDIILMDISMPGMGGIEVTRQIRTHHPAIRVLMLTVHEDKELLQEALRSGANGYVLKQAVKSELINAIHAVSRGELYVYSAMTRALFDTNPTQPLPPASKSHDLTMREVEVLRLIARGYTSREIAEQLNISVRTVEFHRGNLMAKLDIDSRVGLVRYAAEHDLI